MGIADLRDHVVLAQIPTVQMANLPKLTWNDRPDGHLLWKLLLVPVEYTSQAQEVLAGKRGSQDGLFTEQNLEHVDPRILLKEKVLGWIGVLHQPKTDILLLIILPELLGGGDTGLEQRHLLMIENLLDRIQVQAGSGRGTVS